MQTFDSSYTLLFIIVGSTWVLIIDAMLQHMIDDASQLVGRGNNGLCGTVARFEASIKGAKGTVASGKGLCSHPQTISRSSIRLLRPTPLDLAAGHLVVGTET